MQPHYDDDAMSRAMAETDDSLHDMHVAPSQASSAQPRKSYQAQLAQFAKDREMYTEASLKAYNKWWNNRMRKIGAENKTKFTEFMTTGNGLCRAHPLKCINGFPKYEHYAEFLELLERNGEWGKRLRSHLMTLAMPTMVAKVHSEGKGGSKSKSKSMRRRRNRRKSKTNKRRRHH